MNHGLLEGLNLENSSQILIPFLLYLLVTYGKDQYGPCQFEEF